LKKLEHTAEATAEIVKVAVKTPYSKTQLGYLRKTARREKKLDDGT